MTNQGKLTTIVSGVIIVGMVLTAIIWYNMYARDQATQRESLRADYQELRKNFARFQYSTKLYQETIENHLQQIHEALSGVRELFSMQKTVTWDEFKGFASPIHEQSPEVHGVFWIPQIDHEELHKFIQVAAEESPPGVRLRIDTGDTFFGTDMWPIYFVFPVESNRSWFGLNAKTHPILAGMCEGYVDRRQPWTSIAFSVEGDSRPEDFFLAIHLTREERKLAKDSEHTVLHESGFVAALINIPTLVDAAVDDLDAEPLKIYLYDREGRRIATHGPLTEQEQKASQSKEQLKETLKGTTYIEREINLAGEERYWHAICETVQPIGRSTPNESAGGNYSWLVAIFGLLITILMAVLGYRIMNEMLRRKAAEEEQRQLAEHDDLTKLLNRNVLANILEREWIRSCQAGQPFSVIVLDLDHFKSINDTYGHKAGDDVLRHMGTILCNSARQTDAVCRYGGEEFCLILPKTDSHAAYIVADRIRDKLASQAFSMSQNAPEAEIHITCSVGIATASASDSSGEEVLQRADAALFSAKKYGRNQVVAEEKS